MAKSKVLSSIDIGSSKTAVLIAQYREDDVLGKVHIVGASSTVTKGVRKGQIVNIEEAVSSINEAVDLAKKYGDLESGKFVNGVLGAVYRDQLAKGLEKAALHAADHRVAPTQQRRRLVEAAAG